ncbi:hypothetical protein COU74_00545 [Candidatus Peregrinibacteria bacterium CG10_big_fil_rev_8_21_14_0_10_36_19]|nr:MAG: hypothetical protein COU74_00545 [Candidatus Peregrinibacteria bacterium CG10_big_fil_rev_8_21_14_0_10_36_19]
MKLGRLITKINGFSIIEVLLAITVFAIFSIGIFYLSLDTIGRNVNVQVGSEAIFYAQEGLEAARRIRDQNYLSLTNGDHGLNFTTDVWSFVPAPEDVDGFYERTVTVDDVYRDVNGDIADSGTFDPDTKKVTSEISWLFKGIFPKSVSLVTYISNWTGDDFVQTTCTEFDAGTYTDMESVAQPSPPADNCSIQLILEEEGSGFFSSVDVGDHGNDVYVDGSYAYIANNKVQAGFSVIDVSDVNNPYVVKDVDVGGRGRKITKSGNNVFLGIEKSNAGLGAVNVSSPASSSLSDTLDVDAYGNDMVVSGNYLFMGNSSSDDSFRIIDISNPTALNEVSSFDLNAVVQDVAISGSYAFLGLDDDLMAFRVVDIANVNSPTVVASIDVGEEVNSVYISGPFAYLGTEDSANSLYVVNISDPENPSVITSLNVGGEIQDLVVQDSYLYAAVDEQNVGLAAVNVSNPFSPTLVYNLDLTGKGTGVDADENYVYVTLDTNNKGLVIVGVTQASIVLSGTFESSVFDTNSTFTRYNFIEWDHVEVPGGDVRFQIRTASSVGGLSSATWVGPDGTNATYYEDSRTPIVIDPAASGVRYFQYKVFIDSDGANSPVINSVRVNFIP